MDKDISQVSSKVGSFLKSTKGKVIIFVLVLSIVSFIVYNNYKKKGEREKYSGYTKSEVEAGIKRAYFDWKMQEWLLTDTSGEENIVKWIDGEYGGLEIDKTELIRGLQSMNLGTDVIDDFNYLIGTKFTVSSYI